MGYKGEVSASHRGTVSDHLDTGPGVVYWINSSFSASAGLLRIRDGSDDDAEIIFSLRELLAGGKCCHFSPPLPYKRGLFVELVTTITDYTIVFDHLDD